MTFAPTPDVSPPFKAAVTIPAATLIVFRHGGGAAEVLVVERARAMRFAPGAVVFPGGRVDPGDRTLAARLAPDLPPADGPARIAAIRETLEETGLALGIDRPVSAAEAARARQMLASGDALASVLEAMDWRLDPTVLIPFAHWCPDWQGAFDTWFYLADIGTGQVVVSPDGTENTRAFWTSAADAVRLADAGEISLLFPTRRSLERLAQFATFAAARTHVEATPIRPIVPTPVEHEGEMWLTISGRARLSGAGGQARRRPPRVSCVSGQAVARPRR